MHLDDMVVVLISLEGDATTRCRTWLSPSSVFVFVFVFSPTLYSFAILPLRAPNPILPPPPPLPVRIRFRPSRRPPIRPPKSASRGSMK
ncbi:hypothetical protein ZWY2020_038828 [Hordeum vulgare]|nr:hypothetical protein ZWY2020_038828 [Hordeum vulgare]